jgi:hypothetical protein
MMSHNTTSWALHPNYSAVASAAAFQYQDILNVNGNPSYSLKVNGSRYLIEESKLTNTQYGIQANIELRSSAFYSKELENNAGPQLSSWIIESSQMSLELNGVYVSCVSPTRLSDGTEGLKIDFVASNWQQRKYDPQQDRAKIIENIEAIFPDLSPSEKAKLVEEALSK